MKVRMNQLSDFQKFYQLIKDKNCSISTAYKLNKLSNSAETELAFYQQKFMEIVATYAKKDDNGGYIYSSDGASIEIIDGKQNECQERVNELQNLEVEIPDIKFKLSEFDSLDSIKIYELQWITPFITE